jgi:hypothetical protein
MDSSLNRATAKTRPLIIIISSYPYSSSSLPPLARLGTSPVSPTTVFFFILSLQRCWRPSHPSEVYIEPLHPLEIQLSSSLSNVKMLTRPSFLLVLACAYVHVSSIPLGITS